MPKEKRESRVAGNSGDTAGFSARQAGVGLNINYRNPKARINELARPKDQNWKIFYESYGSTFN